MIAAETIEASGRRQQFPSRLCLPWQMQIMKHGTPSALKSQVVDQLIFFKKAMIC